MNTETVNNEYAIGLDYGTNSVRALIVDVATGEEVGTSVWGYAHGNEGVLLDPRNPNLARQHPADYLTGRGSHDQSPRSRRRRRDVPGLYASSGHRSGRRHDRQFALAGR